MSPNQSNAPDDYFNDLSRQPELGLLALDSPPDRSENPIPINGEEPGLPKPKRIACVICRKRKLKCDGTKPSCGTCSRLGHNCAYDEVRRKSGPKRGYVKELEARLAQVETQLKSKIHKKPTSIEPRIPMNKPAETSSQSSARGHSASLSQNGSLEELMSGAPFETTRDNNSNISPPAGAMPDFLADLNHSSWDMIRLGLEEPLPTQEAIDELSETYFTCFHPTAPMIHKFRHRAAMSLAPHMRPPVCLRYAMWCLAASVNEKYYNHQEIFYRRARKYAESDEMRGQGEAFGTLAHAQCWVLLASYEFKMMYFPRAWASSGRASRLCIMLGCNRLDNPVSVEVKKTGALPRDWTDREERSRTFWMAYCVDRYASIGTGWPTAINEKDIRTNMPAFDEAFDNSISQQTQPLSEAITFRDMSSLSPFGGVVLMAHHFEKCLTHIHQPEPNEQIDDLQGEFWKRHRNMDNALLTTALSLPSHLRLPAGVRNGNVVFLNMALHTAIISLHTASIFEVDRHDLPMNIVEHSGTRCLLAALEVTTIMRLSSHIDVLTMNPFVAFCLFVAANVFIKFLKKKPNEQEIRASLEFLLGAMQALKRRNPLSESFLIQLGLEIEAAGLDILQHNSNFPASKIKGTGIVPADFDSLKCSPLFELRDPRTTKKTAGNSPTKPRSRDPATNDNNGSSSFTFRGDGTQFSLQNLNLPMREQRTQPQLWNQSSAYDAVKGRSIRVDPNIREWSTDSTGAFITGFVDANAGFDTNMSENNSDEQRSSYLTPSTNHSSSNTSYSSPQELESENSNSNGHGTIHNSFVSTDEIGYPPSSIPGQQREPVGRNKGDGDLTVPQAWQLGSTGDPPSALPALSPGDNGWVQLMDGLMWDATSIGQDLGLENLQWNEQTGSRS